MFTDTVGFTASAQTDEAGALELRRQQANLLRPLFGIHDGREIKSTGDGFLVEFDSALKAVQCALNVQRRIHERNAEGGQAPIQIRIGVHLGDVVPDGADIVGDAVNLAARIEPLAEPGGICVSGAVYDQVRAKVHERFERLQAQAMKGVQVPVDVYRVLLAWTSETAEGPEDGAVGTVDRTRIAVLPFANISPDPSDEYFADGLTEELIANLSLVPGLKVIARTSIIGYRKTDKKVATIGRELSVGTVVEGSVRRAANRIRVTVQVIDVATEEHLWTAKYDDDLADIFKVQTDIATKVATALPVNLSKTAATMPTLEKPTETKAYLSFLQGQALTWKRDIPSLRQSLKHFQESIHLDPTFGRAYVGMARAYVQLTTEGDIPWAEAIRLGKSAAEKAAAMDPSLADAHAILAELAFMADDTADLLDNELRRALELNPNLAEALNTLGGLAGSLGILEGYVAQAEAAYRLDPLSPPTIRSMGNALYFSGQGEEALAFWKKHKESNPVDMLRGMADYYFEAKDLDQAETCVAEMERIAPENSLTEQCRGYLLALRGDRAGAMKVIERMQSHRSDAQLGNIGFVFLGLGNLDKFFEYMFASARAHTLQMARVRFSPLMATARRDPRFIQLLSLYGRPVQPVAR
ncbi:MAG TPA: adenylate/guanylate cyclase domain-containing protein [Thermoplasmata archaeon]|nr:adenylate/guanylate cyclase domain-containing protein [Thermoplasmata archaeon]